MSVEPVESVERFIARIQELKPEAGHSLLYRGNYKPVPRLQPQVLRRPEWRAGEAKLLAELMALHADQFEKDPTALEKLARAQHYGLPTRLLDMTWNPLVALYFASKELPDRGDRNRERCPGEVVVLQVAERMIKFHDSHKVAVIANLAFMKEKVRKELRAFAEANAGDPERIKAFARTDAAMLLEDSIKEEKPYWMEERIDPEHLMLILCVRPKHTIQRLLVQSGAFLLWGLADGIESVEGISVLERIPVAAEAKEEVLEQLDRLSIHPGTMFPEIDRAADYIASRYINHGA